MNVVKALNLSLFNQRKIARFIYKHRYKPNLRTPKKYSEKLLYRILFKRDPRYKLFGCKLTSPVFAKSRTKMDLSFPKQLKVYRELDRGFWRYLPKVFVLKGSFSSGLNYIVRDKFSTDFAPIRRKLNKWVREKKNAQGIRDPMAAIIAEELLLDHWGQIPPDYKFHCFNNSEGFRFFLQLDIDRRGNHNQILTDENLNILPFSWENKMDVSDDLPEIPNFEKMVALSEELSKGFNYIRIDFYSIGKAVYFGEYTPFHRAAMSPIASKRWEFKLGDLWEQNKTNQYFFPDY